MLPQQIIKSLLKCNEEKKGFWTKEFLSAKHLTSRGIYSTSPHMNVFADLLLLVNVQFSLDLVKERKKEKKQAEIISNQRSTCQHLLMKTVRSGNKQKKEIIEKDKQKKNQLKKKHGYKQKNEVQMMKRKKEAAGEQKEEQQEEEEDKKEKTRVRRI